MPGQGSLFGYIIAESVAAAAHLAGRKQGLPGGAGYTCVMSNGGPRRDDGLRSLMCAQAMMLIPRREDVGCSVGPFVVGLTGHLLRHGRLEVGLRMGIDAVDHHDILEQ